MIDSTVSDTIKIGHFYLLNKHAKFAGSDRHSHNGKIYDIIYYIEHGDPPTREYVPASVCNQFNQDLRDERRKTVRTPGQYNNDYLDEMPK